MKKLILINSLLLLFLFASCKKEIHELEDKNAIEAEKVDVSADEITKNSDEDFTAFLDLFSKDSLFQMSRIHFPLKVKKLDDDFEVIERTIAKNQYTMLNFTHSDDTSVRQFDAHRHEIKITKDKAVIEIRGIDNGISSDFFFEKVDGKWILKSWTDEST